MKSINLPIITRHVYQYFKTLRYRPSFCHWPAPAVHVQPAYAEQGLIRRGYVPDLLCSPAACVTWKGRTDLITEVDTQFRACRCTAIWRLLCENAVILSEKFRQSAVNATTISKYYYISDSFCCFSLCFSLCLCLPLSLFVALPVRIIMSLSLCLSE